MRGTSKPRSGTSQEWNDWQKKAKEKKLRYWLAEDGLDFLEKVILWPINFISEIRFYINNRYLIKSHALTSNLRRGTWYDFDTRLLHTAFDELVNFVEIELAWMHAISSSTKRNFLRLGRWRSAEAGLAYLDWASHLKMDEDWIDKNDPDYGQPTQQALAAQETLRLYRWWKEERPKRPDPIDASGLAEYYKEKRHEAKTCGDSFLHHTILNKKDGQLRNLSDLYHRIEKQQEEEDTAMLIRLVEIRQSLWT